MYKADDAELGKYSFIEQSMHIHMLFCNLM